MREILKLGGKLLLLAAVAGLLLGLTNAVTAEPIARQQIAEANAARRAVLPEAQDFAPVETADDAVDELYRGTDASGATVGYTGKITVKGYGGPIEVTVGVGLDGKITGVNVGGTNFSETAGLGAKTKDEAFTSRFAGLNAADSGSIAVRQDGGVIDAVSSATVSSRAVSNGVNTVCGILQTLLTEGN